VAALKLTLKSTVFLCIGKDESSRDHVEKPLEKLVFGYFIF